MTIYEISLQGFNDLMEKEQAIKSYQDCDVLKMMFTQREDYRVEDGIAYIDVFGPLKRNATEFEEMAGFTDYEDILEELQCAAQDISVMAVCLTIDSCGGESIGSSEVASYIESFPKPVVAVVQAAVCMSAAYKLASACTQILATESSEIGNIGSLVVLDNTKIMYNTNGVFKTVITNAGATLKGIGSDFGDLSDEQQAFLQQKVDESGKRFQDIVIRNRPEVNTEVFNAGFYVASKAMELGLIDSVIWFIRHISIKNTLWIFFAKTILN